MIKYHSENDGLIVLIYRKDIPQEYFYISNDEIRELYSLIEPKSINIEETQIIRKKFPHWNKD